MLDEPQGSLRGADPSATTVLVTTSPLLLSRCDRVVLLTGQGRQLTGTHADLLDDPDYADAVAR